MGDQGSQGAADQIDSICPAESGIQHISSSSGMNFDRSQIQPHFCSLSPGLQHRN